MKISNELYAKSYKFVSDALVLFEYAPDKKQSSRPNFSVAFNEIDKKFKGIISQTTKDENFDFKLGSSIVIRLNQLNNFGPAQKSIKKLILVGLGSEKLDLDTIDGIKKLRKVAASTIRQARNEKSEKLAIRWTLAKPSIFFEIATLLTYEFNKYKTEDAKSKENKKKLSEIRILLDEISKQDKDLCKKSQIIAKGTCLARDLVWEPASVVTPSYLAEKAKEIKGEKIKVTIKEAAECEKLGMGSFLAVSYGSDQPPKFIEISYKASAKVNRHIALIGKGVTFDSGGLSLKPAKAMEMMKEDMSGAAAILGIMNIVSQINPPDIEITAIIAATENMPNGRALKPGDVITAMNGKTIEVNNTDAEGRLTLADAVAYVSEKNPDLIIDFATLTGACTVALGNICAGLMGNDQALIDKIKAASEKTGELMWQLPLYDEYKEKLKSTIADLINANSGGQAGAQNGALFIQEFVGKQKSNSKPIPWAHIDIAGPCWLEAENDWSTKGASGIPVRTIIEFLEI